MTTTPPALHLERIHVRASTPIGTDARIARLIRRGAEADPSVLASAALILEGVRQRGASAVREANQRYGGGLHDGRLVIEREELRAAQAGLGRPVRVALDHARDQVRRFAEAQRPATATVETAPGITIERRWTAVQSVGAYAPGGTAPYPSSLVMTVVPAQVAGVTRIVAASPAGADGRVASVLLGTAGLLGVDRLVVAGGAQAIGALAFGLPEIDFQPVDLIVGPGNAWVTAAKLQVAGQVGIDLPAGPSEGMVLAMPPAEPAIVAADLITQAEHGPDSPALLVTLDERFADAVEAAVAHQLESTHRRGILERSLAAHGAIVIADDLASAIAFINAYAPEHLSVDVPDLEDAVARIRNAGSVFVGRWAAESAGDYATGANHVLPTGGLARAASPLGVDVFGKYTQVQRVTRDGLAGLRSTIGTLAEAEGLLAHRNAVEIRFTEGTPAGGERERPGKEVRP